MAHRIDTHIHVVPPTYRKAVEDAGGDPSGWTIPDWSVDLAINILDRIEVQKAVWSITSPGPCIAGTGDEARRVARESNAEIRNFIHQKPDRFAYFAALPSWVDVEGVLAEINHVNSVEPRPLGYTTMTSYSGKLLGDPAFDKIWDKLESLKAVLFIHPAATNIQPHLIGGALPQPLIDYPQATTRTAADLVVRGHLSKYRNVKVILSHSGGTLPFLHDRLARGLSAAAVKNVLPDVDTETAREDFKRFYIDVAIASTKTALTGLLEMTTPDKILFGSDWPYASEDKVLANTERFRRSIELPEFSSLKAANSENAKRLFGWS